MAIFHEGKTERKVKIPESGTKRALNKKVAILFLEVETETKRD